MFAQLRDVQTAEDSTVLAKKNKYRNPLFPKRSQPNLLTIAIGKHNVSQRETERNCHSLPRLHHNPFANLIAWKNFSPGLAQQSHTRHSALLFGVGNLVLAMETEDSAVYLDQGAPPYYWLIASQSRPSISTCAFLDE